MQQTLRDHFKEEISIFIIITAPKRFSYEKNFSVSIKMFEFEIKISLLTMFQNDVKISLEKWNSICECTASQL